MIPDRHVKAVAAAILLTPLWPAAAWAQFGVNLPRDDFTWVWADQQEAVDERSRDFAASGSEGGFRCDLTGKLRLGSRLTPSDVRQLENDLRVSMFFIQAAANAMNVLDRRRDLDWAKLDCAKPQSSEENAEKRQERLDRAREKMIEEQRERRERQQRQEADP